MDSPSSEQIAAWRKQYHGLYSLEAKDQTIYFRALTIEEFEDARSYADESSAEVEDHIVATCVLSPDLQVMDRFPAGVITSLAEQIVNMSGFGDAKVAKRVLDAQREAASRVVYLMKAFILATMPRYSDEDLNRMNFVQLAEKVALAEKIIQVQQAILPLAAGEGDVTLNLIDPEEQQQIEQEEKTKHAAQKKPGTAGYNDPIAARLRNALGG